MKTVPINKETEVTRWVVGLADGSRVFIEAATYYQDDTSIVFHNGEGPNFRDLVLQVEKIHMMWFLQDRGDPAVMIESPVEATDQEEDYETED